MISEAALLLSMSFATEGLRASRRHFVVSSTHSTETTLPPGVAPTSLLETATGETLVRVDAGAVAASAIRYAHALAVLPTDAAHEARIDRLVDAQIRGVAGKRPLRKRP